MSVSGVAILAPHALLPVEGVFLALVVAILARRIRRAPSHAQGADQAEAEPVAILACRERRAPRPPSRSVSGRPPGCDPRPPRTVSVTRVDLPTPGWPRMLRSSLAAYGERPGTSPLLVTLGARVIEINLAVGPDSSRRIDPGTS
jgi:hypothetical protein